MLQIEHAANKSLEESFSKVVTAELATCRLATALRQAKISERLRSEGCKGKGNPKKTTGGGSAASRHSEPIVTLFEMGVRHPPNLMDS